MKQQIESSTGLFLELHSLKSGHGIYTYESDHHERVYKLLIDSDVPELICKCEVGELKKTISEIALLPSGKVVEQIKLSQLTKDYIDNHDVMCEGVHCKYQELTNGFSGKTTKEYIVLNSNLSTTFSTIGQLKKYIKGSK